MSRRVLCPKQVSQRQRDAFWPALTDPRVSISLWLHPHDAVAQEL